MLASPLSVELTVETGVMSASATVVSTPFDHLQLDELRRRQQQLHVVVPESSHLVRVLTITGVDRAVPMHATVESALAGTR